MYSNIESVQYLIVALKKANIDTAVISPGNSHNAIVRSMEEDGFFQTYSVVDERSAAFFACGLAQELKKPIMLCCTAGTAAINYLSGITEAYRRNLPLVVITADKNPYYYKQGEDQMVDQVTPFKAVTRYNCRLPIVVNDKDRWYCKRLLNEAILELDHHGKGPIQIDVPIEEGMFAIGRSFSTEQLPEFQFIKRFELNDTNEPWEEVFSSLDGKRIMIVCGQDTNPQPLKAELLEQIFNKYNCFFAIDKLSNLHCKGTVNASRVVRRNQNNINDFMPDVLISIDGNSTDFKFVLKNKKYTFDHWMVTETGEVCDPFKKLSIILEGSTIDFLSLMARYGSKSDHSYYRMWKDQSDLFIIPQFEYSNVYCIEKMMKSVPEMSNLSIGNSTPIRLAQFFDLNETVIVFCNRGVNGIDGCVSSFIGQAAANREKLNFLIVGDLSFFYDMNSLWNRYVGNNVRIMLSNNGGASLFHFNQGLNNYPTINENVAAAHEATAEAWVKSRGFRYLSAYSKDEFDNSLEEFVSDESSEPIFFEVFTKKEADAKVQHAFFDAVTLPAKEQPNQQENEKQMGLGKRTKEAVKVFLGEDLVNKIRTKKI